MKVNAEGIEPLTPREQEVLELLRQGLADAQIAERLGISLAGVRYHVSEIISKLGVRNRHEAAAWPERPPWWVGALAPATLLWRKTKAALPIKSGPLATALAGSAFAAALGGLALLAFLLFNTSTGAVATIQSKPPLACGAAACDSSGDERGASADAREPGTMAVDCAAQVDGVQRVCSAAVGATFPVQIHIAEPPEGGYTAFQGKLRWDPAVVTYLPTSGPSAEAQWPECDIPARRDNRPEEPSVVFGCVPLLDRDEPNVFTGVVWQLEFRCEAEGTTLLDLAQRAGDAQEGSHFVGSDDQPIDPALAQGQVACGTPPCPPAGCVAPPVVPPPSEPPSQPPSGGTPGPTSPANTPPSEGETPAPPGTPGAPDAPVPTPEPPVPTTAPPGGSLCLTTDFQTMAWGTDWIPTYEERSDFILGEGVGLLLKVLNCDGEPVQELPADMRVRFAVSDASGQEIWATNEYLWRLTFTNPEAEAWPYGSFVWWDQLASDALPILPGTYDVSAVLTACGSAKAEQQCPPPNRRSIEIRIPNPDEPISGCPAWLAGELSVEFELGTTAERAQEIVSTVGELTYYFPESHYPEFSITLRSRALVSVPYGQERAAILELRHFPEVTWVNVEFALCLT